MEKHFGFLCSKEVTAADVHLPEIAIADLSEVARRVIEESELPSLKRLLGPDSRQALRQLVERYWA